jgi:hypothetical protein
VAETLRNEPDAEVRVENGSKGEFTVSVDGEVVSRKGEALPPPEEVVAAVRKKGATART